MCRGYAVTHTSLLGPSFVDSNHTATPVLNRCIDCMHGMVCCSVVEDLQLMLDTETAEKQMSASQLSPAEVSVIYTTALCYKINCGVES